MSTLIVDVQPTHNPRRWYLPLRDTHCVGPGDLNSMFGGVGLAASVQALERTCKRPLVWATAQYLSFAKAPSVIDLDVIIPVEGRAVTQARVVGHVGEKEIFTVNAALGSRPARISQDWGHAPVVAPPQDCPPTVNWREEKPGMRRLIDARVAAGRFDHDGADLPDPGPDSQVILWMRLVDDSPIDATMLALFADHIPYALGHAVGFRAGGTSLDNTIRIVRVVPTQWVLCDVRVHAIDGGFAHGAMRLFSQDGALMAMGSQSMILRDQR
ncbi:MAG: acyl-CoA thioesterase [Sphingobium sp.]